MGRSSKYYVDVYVNDSLTVVELHLVEQPSVDSYTLRMRQDSGLEVTIRALARALEGKQVVDVQCLSEAKVIRVQLR